MYKKKHKKKKYIVISIIIILGIILIYLDNKKENYLEIENFFKNLGASLENILTPKVKIDNKDTINNIDKEIEKENNSLKEMLNLNIENYNLIHADVIKRDIIWYSEITINKGSRDNIKKDMAVISNNRLIGKVVKVLKNSSVIKLITSPDMKISVSIKTEEDEIHGILDNYDKEDRVLIINNIDKNSNINIGDKVYTNGLGGIYPNGIYIGEVNSISYDELGLNKIVKINIKEDYYDLRYVSVVNKE